MTYEESVSIAKQLAENQLKKGFDVDAFIILTLLSNKPQISADNPVPESGIDESINNIMNKFVDYFYNKTTDNLEILLSTIHKMLSELYHSTDTEQERELFREHFKTLAEI